MRKIHSYSSLLAVFALVLVLAGCSGESEQPETVAELKSFMVLAGDTTATLSWDFADGASPKGVHIFWGTELEALNETRFVESGQNETEITGLTNGESYGFAAEVEGQTGVRSVRSIAQFVHPYGPDSEAPTIVATTPVDGAIDVDTQSLLSVTFSEPMDTSRVTIEMTPARVLNTFHWNEDRTELVTGPATPWRQGVTYEAKILGRDVSGNPVSGVDVFSFTVGYEQLSPEITGNSPEQGMINVPTNTRVSVTFAEPMEPISTNRALSVSPDIPMSYDHDEQQQTFTWTPQASLEPDTNYTVTVGASAQNMRGQALGQDIVFDFTTMTGPDETPPAISSFLPEDDALGQERHFEIAIAFTEPMDHAWTQAALVISSHPGLTGTYTWSNGGTVMRFVPDEDPEFGEVFSWQLLGQAKDLAGNEIGSDTLATFRILRLVTETIFSDPAIDGTIARFNQPGEYGTHYVNTDYGSMSLGMLNYTNFGPSVQRGFYSFDLSVLPEDLTRIHNAVIKHIETGAYPSDCAQIGYRFLESVPIGPELTQDDFDVPVISFYFCYPDGDCSTRPFRTLAPCIENWFWYMGGALWTSWVTPAVQNDWDDRQARMHLSQWRLSIEMENSNLFPRRTYLSNHWQIDPERRPYMVVDYLIP